MNAPQSDYRALLPIEAWQWEDGWIGKIALQPMQEASDRLRYGLTFQNAMGKRRTLNLWVSNVGLHHDSNQKYKGEIYAVVSNWLLSGEENGELQYFGK